MKWKNKKTPPNSCKSMHSPYWKCIFGFQQRQLQHACLRLPNDRQAYLLSTGEFAKVITSIISLPWQPHNIQLRLSWVTHTELPGLPCRAETSEPRSNPGQSCSSADQAGKGRGIRGAPAAPAIPSSLISWPHQWWSAQHGEGTGLLHRTHYFQMAAGVWEDPSSGGSARAFFFPNN